MGKKGRATRTQRQVVYRKAESRPVATLTATPEMSEATKPVETPVVRQPARPAAPPYAGARAGAALRRGVAAPVPVDYSYVRHDLRRIGILVGLILLVLITLTFVLR